MTNANLTKNVEDGLTTLRKYETTYEADKKEFIEHVTQNPTQAIHWDSPDMVISQYKFVEAGKLTAAWDQLTEGQRTPEKYEEFLAFIRKDLESNLLSNRFSGHSTSPWSNAIEGAKADACVSLIREIEYLQCDVESAKREDRRDAARLQVQNKDARWNACACGAVNEVEYRKTKAGKETADADVVAARNVNFNAEGKPSCTECGNDIHLLSEPLNSSKVVA